MIGDATSTQEYCEGLSETVGRFPLNQFCTRLHPVLVPDELTPSCNFIGPTDMHTAKMKII